MTVSSSPARPKAPHLALLCLGIFVAALGVRLAYALTRPIPVSADAAYYTMVAENLYHGRGFVADYVWNYLAGMPASLPVPSNEYWMPGTSIVTAAAFLLSHSTSPRVAQLPALVFGALLCAVSAWIAGILSRRRDVILLTGAAAALNYYLVELSLSPDHFMLNAVFVNLSIIALWAAWRRSTVLGLAAGALAAIAYLVRTDGGLLVVVALFLAFELWRRGQRARSLQLALFFIATFAVVSAPWWTRQMVVFGSPAGANPLRTAFLTEYNDLFRLDQSHLNLRHYLDATYMLSLDGKMGVVGVSLRLLLKAVMLLGPLAAAGLLFRGLRRSSVPWLLYLPIGLATPALLVPFPALRGGLWHIMPAFVPVILALAACSGVFLIDRARRSGHRAAGPAACLALVVCLLSPCYWWIFPPPTAGHPEPLYPPVAVRAVGELGPDPTPALTDNAWGLYQVARIPCAQFPTDGVDAALRVADSIGASYLITRADASDKIPRAAEIVGHPRFQPLVRYPAGDTRLLVYRIIPASAQPPQSPSATRRRISQ